MITTYSETDLDLKVNKIDRETFDTLSAEQISPKELWFITSADSVVVDIDKIGVSRDWTPEISALSSEIDDVETQIQELDLSAIQQELSATQSTLSAMEEVAEYIEGLSAVADLSAVEELVDGKRDYDDLTYNTVSTQIEYEQFDSSLMTPDQSLPLSDQVSAINAYRSGMRWDVVLSGDPRTYTLEYVPAIVDDEYEEEQVSYGFWQLYDYNENPIDIYWDDTSGVFSFEANSVDEGGEAIGVPTDGSTTWTVSAFNGRASITLTMPSTSTSTTTYDSIALESQLSAYVPTSQFDLSGLGCTTLNLSGTYEDETTFSYDFVITEANQ